MLLKQLQMKYLWECICNNCMVMKTKDLSNASNFASKKWNIQGKSKQKKELQSEPLNSYFYPDLSNVQASVVREPESLNYSQVEPMLDFLGYNQKEAAIFLEVDPGTISRWKRNKIEIGKLRTKNLMNVDEIIAKGIRIFGNEQLFKEWLHASNDALGDVKPVELLKDPYGVTQVEEAVDALSWGNYL